VPGVHLNHRFLEPTIVEFWACQEAENDFEMHFDHLNRHITKVTFSVGQETENDFKVPWAT